jgi:hypothetical protein
MQDISSDELSVIGLFIPPQYLLNSFLVCKQWRQTLDNENFYETATKTFVKDVLQQFDKTWKLTFISFVVRTWDPNRKNDLIEISRNGKRVTLAGGSNYFAKIALKHHVPMGVTLSVSVKLHQIGSGHTLLGACAEPLLSKDTSADYFFESWNSCATHIGFYKDMNKGYNSVDSMDLTDLNIGFCDNGYLCRDTIGNSYNRLSKGDIMTMEINLTEPLPKESSSMTTKLNTDNHFIAGTQRGTGFIRYFKNGEQTGPTIYNIYLNDPSNPYSVIVVFNMMPGLTADLVDVSTHKSMNAYLLPRDLKQSEYYSSELIKMFNSK